MAAGVLATEIAVNNDLPLHRPALYNPALWSRDEVKTYYIARQPLLTRLLDDLRRERPGSRPQHRLILGLRGMGKSTLLRRLAVAVEDDAELTAQWLPLTFPEEQYNIGSLADLWLNCLDALGDLLEGRGQSTEANRIDDIVANLARQDAEGTLQALLQTAKQLGRRLLLLFDNIDLILERLKDRHWDLRETLQSHTELLVMGASARALETSYQYDAAFYDFFKVDELRGLSEQEMSDTLLALARLRGVPEVERRIEAEPSRIRILHTLTGGNPRTVVLLYGVLLKGMDGDVRADLEGLLDEVTPLYKARFEELPVQGQQLLDKLALHWDPMTARQLADALNWDVNLISAQLNRLTRLGIVEKVKSGSGKRAAFQVGERFFNIWYLMRASRRVRRKLVWLVEFLGIWYSGEELRRNARACLKQGASCEWDAEYHLALSQALRDEPLARALETQALYALVGEDTRTALEEILDLRGNDRPLLPKVERIRELKALRKAVEHAFEKAEVDFDKQIFIERLLGSVSNIRNRKLLIEKVAGFSVSQWKRLNDNLQEEWDLIQRFYGKSTNSLYQAFACGDIGEAHDLEGAETAAEHFNSPLLALIPRFQKLNKEKPIPEETEKVMRQALASEPEAPGLWISLGLLLGADSARYNEAETAFYHAITYDPNYDLAWICLGNVLYSLGRCDEAELACRHAIELNPKEGRFQIILAFILQRLKRPNEISYIAQKALDLAPSDNHVLLAGSLFLLQTGKIDEAFIYCRHLFAQLDDSYTQHYWNVLLLLFQEGLKAGAGAQLLQALDDSGAGERWQPLREALAAAVVGKAEILLDVAPEIRKPALEILTRIAPDLPIPADLR